MGVKIKQNVNISLWFSSCLSPLTFQTSAHTGAYYK